MRENAKWMVVLSVDMLATPGVSLNGVDRWSVLFEDAKKAH